MQRVLWSVRLRPPADNAGGFFGCTAASVHAQTVKSAQAHERMAREVEQTRQEALSQKMREEQAQAMALAEAQDKAAAAFYRQIDSVKQARVQGWRELQRIQQQIRQARNSGVGLVSRIVWGGLFLRRRNRVLPAEEEATPEGESGAIRQLKEQATRQNLSSSGVASKQGRLAGGKQCCRSVYPQNGAGRKSHAFAGSGKRRSGPPGDWRSDR